MNERTLTNQADPMGEYDSDYLLTLCVHDAHWKMMADAYTSGCSFIPCSRNAFLAVAPFLLVLLDLDYFHVEVTDFNVSGIGHYTGGIFFICDPKKVKPDFLLKHFRYGGLITTVQDAVKNLEGCIAMEDPAIRSQQIAGLVN